MSDKTIGIEIIFPVDVELVDADYRAFDVLVGAICKRYEDANPGRVMWPFGMGQKIVSMPLTDDAPMIFDEGIFQIEVAERADYRWLCAKCGLPQGDHKECITQAEAGDCDFEPKLEARADA